jgi:hypothetical protein
VRKYRARSHTPHTRTAHPHAIGLPTEALPPHVKSRPPRQPMRSPTSTPHFFSRSSRDGHRGGASAPSRWGTPYIEVLQAAHYSQSIFPSAFYATLSRRPGIGPTSGRSSPSFAAAGSVKLCSNDTPPTGAATELLGRCAGVWSSPPQGVDHHTLPPYRAGAHTRPALRARRGLQPRSAIPGPTRPALAPAAPFRPQTRVHPRGYFRTHLSGWASPHMANLPPSDRAAR